MILSQKKIEEIAVAVTTNFNEFFFGKGNAEARRVRATPIDQFAGEYLGLDVSIDRLSPDGSICGLTAYEDTNYVIEENGVKRTIPLKKNEVLLDESFVKPGQVRKLCGKRRFTLAHECAHQILYRLESDDAKTSCRKMYAARSAYSLRELKTNEDWNEWQANVLGAAILMPQKEIDLAMSYFASGRQLVSYDGKFSQHDRHVLDMICQQLGVSKSAAKIRLKQLGYIIERPYIEIFDSLEVLA